MKAAVIHGKGESIGIEEQPKPVRGKGEVLVEIHSAALNHRDVWIRKGMYAGLKYPCILGSDGAGVVAETGDGMDDLEVGSKVVINPGMNWGYDPAVQSPDFRILGMPDNGTFAEFVTLPREYIHPKPAHLSMAEAAALPLAGITAFRALFSRGRLKAGEKVLITGIGGGVAQMALLFAHAAGARVFVTSGNDLKIEMAEKNGATGGANYHQENWHKKLKQKAGEFHLIVDSAAGDGFSLLADLAAPGGRIVVYGGTTGKINHLSPQKLFWKQLDILGSTMGTNEEFRQMLRFVNGNKITPGIDKIFPLEDTEAAFRRMDQGLQTGKIVVTVK